MNCLIVSDLAFEIQFFFAINTNTAVPTLPESFISSIFKVLATLWLLRFEKIVRNY